MAGTYAGGKKAANTNLRKQGADFYRKIGRLGGLKSRNGGFAQNRELARKVGAEGGRKSKRSVAKIKELDKISDRILADIENPNLFFYEIADKYGVSTATLRTWLRKQGATVKYQSWREQVGGMTVAEAQERNEK